MPQPLATVPQQTLVPARGLVLSYLVAGLLLPISAAAQKGHQNVPSKSAITAPTPVSTVACPAPLDVPTAMLYGLWRVSFFDGPLPTDTRLPPGKTATHEATVLFERHPEHEDSLRGAMKSTGTGAATQPTQVVWLSGDLEEGELIMDESEDGERISAVWVAYPTLTGCGKELRGNRRQSDNDRIQTLILTKAAGWQ